MNTPADLVTAVEAKLVELYEGNSVIEFPFRTRLGAQPDSSPIRPSAAGSCARQTAYKVHYPDEGEPILPRGITTFLHGDLLHEQERWLISQVAPLSRIEEVVSLDFGAPIGEVTGQTDGVVNIGGTDYVLDVKSISRFGFRDVEANGARDYHQTQLNVYMAALGIKQGLVWYFNKDTGHRYAAPVDYDTGLLSEAWRRFEAVASSTPDNLPEREYEPQVEIRRGKQTGREYLPWQCTYCQFTHLCWEPEGFDMEIERGKPRWLRGEAE